MDWDEPKTKTGKSFTLGEDLSRLSVSELEERAADLKSEIARIETTVAAKKRTNAAAAALFGKE